MEFDEASELLTKYSTQLETGAIKDLPPEYYVALSTIIKQLNDLKSEHYTPPPPDTWTDLWAMIDDMADHAKNNGRALMCCDQPAFLLFGWVCQNTEKTWFIRIADFKEQFKKGRPQTPEQQAAEVESLKKEAEESLIPQEPLTPEERRNQLYDRLVRTQDGKLNFCEVINNLRK